MTTPSPSIPQLLSQLEQVLRDGEAELKQRPAELTQLKALHAELKRVVPGQQPSAKLIGLLQAFFQTQLDREVAEQQERLAASSKQTGAVAMADTAAHRQVLDALTQARKAVPAIDPTVPAEVVESAGVRLANANASASQALANAEALRALRLRPAPKK